MQCPFADPHVGFFRIGAHIDVSTVASIFAVESHWRPRRPQSSCVLTSGKRHRVVGACHGKIETGSPSCIFTELPCYAVACTGWSRGVCRGRVVLHGLRGPSVRYKRPLPVRWPRWNESEKLVSSVSYGIVVHKRINGTNRGGGHRATRFDVNGTIILFGGRQWR